MKINGVKVMGAFEEVVVFPRTGTPNLVFKARAVLDYDKFEKLCPEPKAPMILFAGASQPSENVEDVNYVKAFDEWAEMKTSYMVLNSLKATPNLEWETVTSDPATWKNYQKEMKEAGLSPAEQGRVILCVSVANGLDQSKIDEATESFLVAQAALADTADSPVSAQPVTPSGAPVSASA